MTGFNSFDATSLAGKDALARPRGDGVGSFGSVARLARTFPGFWPFLALSYCAATS